MREKLYRFMSGRYGVDQLSKFILFLTIILILLSTFTNIRELYWIAIAFIGIAYYRMLSKNYSKRYKENQVYLKYHNGVLGFFKKKSYLFKQRKTHHIYNCPSCKQKIRIPKGKGKISITCPKCKTSFIKKS